MAWGWRRNKQNPWPHFRSEPPGPGTVIAECDKRYRCGQIKVCLEVKKELNLGNRGRLSMPWRQPRSQPACLVSAVSSGEKKEGWSWESYLEEQKAVTAPVSLFLDVSWAISV